MAPRKKNLNKRNTVKVPYSTLYTRETAEGKPKAEGPGMALDTPDPGDQAPAIEKEVPAFAKKK